MNALFEDRYSEIKSDFRKDGLYITILIRRKPFVLKVDTGYVGTISMNGDDATAFINDPCKSYENIVGKFAVYPNKWVTISDDYYNSAITVTSSGTSKVGMGIIKGFNWIVDFRKQKVYIKKNSMPLDSENVFPRDIETDIQNEKLMIVSINPKATKAKAGETITAVNGNPVTPANLCEIKALIESKPLNPRFEIQTSTIN